MGEKRAQARESQYQKGKGELFRFRIFSGDIRLKVRLQFREIALEHVDEPFYCDFVARQYGTHEPAMSLIGW